MGTVGAETSRARVLRDNLINKLSSGGQIRTERVLEAFREVPRHMFLPGVDLARAYADEAISTKWETDGRPISSSSQPSIMAVMLEQLGVEPGQRVLEVGAGTGYNAALLDHLVGAGGAVTTVDIDEDVVTSACRQLAAAGHSRVTVVRADGADGWNDGAPYDRIILTVGAEDVAQAWVDQLAVGGRLVIPLSLRGSQRSVAFERAGDHLVSRSMIDCGFMPLRGSLARPGTVRSLGDEPGVLLKLPDEREVDTDGLYAALHRPGDAVPTSVSVSRADVLGGLRLWLALHEPDVGQLTAHGAAIDHGLVPVMVAFPGMVLTSVLLGHGAMAALIGPDPGQVSDMERFDLRVRPFGPDAVGLARRLTDHVRAWASGGRPSTAELRIRAYPRTSLERADPRPACIEMPPARLVLDWQVELSAVQ